jgi:hypothetical protein
MNADDLLQHCLDEVEAGRLTIAECAARYPQVQDLAAHLATAQALRAGPRPAMRPAASAALRARLLEHGRVRSNGRRHEALPAAAPPSPRPVPLARRPAWPWPALPVARLGLALLAALLLLAGATGTLTAAGSSLPGNWLYPVKRSAEAVRLLLTPAPGRAAANLALAQERVRELQVLAGHDAVDHVLLAEVAADFARHSEGAIENTPAAPAAAQAGLLEAILAAIAQEESLLEAVITRAPAPAVPALLQALDESRSQHEQAAAALEAVRVGTDDPPGQTRVPPGQTQVPPGQTRRPDQTNVPFGQTQVPPGQTRVPPGQQTHTAQPQVEPDPTRTPRPGPDNPGGGPPGNCNAGNPNSPNYCTPTPGGEGAASEATAEAPAPTACPTNPGGQPVCR